jgi:RimJ/RimL family protein N-acetyltransferase
LPPGGVDDGAVLKIIQMMVERLHEKQCRGAWMVVADVEVVGLCSYRRPVADGQVEIGYGIAASRRSRGHATRAVAAMLAFASEDATIHTVVAETAVNNPASHRALERNGFDKTGSRLDAEDGEVTIWQKHFDRQRKTRASG